jgi:phosphoglycolate phosphatase
MADSPLRLAVFDIDGTLVDSLRVIAAAMGQAFQSQGLAPPPPERIKEVIGLPLDQAIGKLLPKGSETHNLYAPYVAAYRSLAADPQNHEPLVEGVLETLDALEAAGVLLGVATGKGRPSLMEFLERHDLAGRFVTIQTGDEGPGKPNPHMLLAAMAEAGADAANTVMIGDTTFDIVMATGAGTASIGVSWGYHQPDALEAAGAALLVHRFHDIGPAVTRLVG